VTGFLGVNFLLLACQIVSGFGVSILESELAKPKSAKYLSLLSIGENRIT